MDTIRWVFRVSLLLFVCFLPDTSVQLTHSGTGYGRVLDAVKKASKVVVEFRISTGFSTQIAEDFGRRFGLDVAALGAPLSSSYYKHTLSDF